MINFTVGPVQSSKEVRTLGFEQVPYFRTQEFSQIMLENENLMKKFTFAPHDSRALFLTGSGTASMEATVMNTLDEKDKVLVVNGGGFGQRFVDICNIHEINNTEIKLAYGESLKKEHLEPFNNQGFTGFLVNIHETTTGILYNLDLIGDFCKKNNLFLIVDAVSSFLADPFNMEKCGADIMITGSQKALAVPPGISIMVISPKALERINNSKVKSLYFNLRIALKNGERGQTPFTPAVGILRQINLRLKEIDKDGVDVETRKIKKQAEDFREKIKDLPFEMFSSSPSNALTSLHPLTIGADTLFEKMKDEYEIWICPNGGDLKEKLFRVGHIGDLSIEDNTRLINAFKDMQLRGIL